MTVSALHRVGQFWRHASARVTASEAAAATQILGPALAPLFLQLPANDQRHGLDVLQTVRSVDPQAGRLLQQAALLHDIGKAGTGFSVLDRSLTVFLQAVSPGILQRFVGARPGFKRRYQAYMDHARVGAERVRTAGSPELAAIIAEHHSPDPRSDVTRKLKQADLRN